MSTIFTGKDWSIQRFVSGFANNAFLITCARTGKSVIVDTPADPVELIVAARATRVAAILITHGHEDHLAGFAAVTAEFDVPCGIGSTDRGLLPGPVQQPAGLPAPIDLSTGLPVQIGDIVMRPVATPGHTPGSTCFVLGAPAGPEDLPGNENRSGPSPENHHRAGSEVDHVFTGDTLFPGGPGRSAEHRDLVQMIESIEKHIFPLPDTTVVLPGHGEFTTVGQSKQEYAVFASRPLDPNLSGDVTWK